MTLQVENAVEDEILTDQDAEDADAEPIEQAPPPPPIPEPPSLFRPKQLENFVKAGLSGAQVEGLILKFLLTVGNASGRSIAAQLGLPYGLFSDELWRLQAMKLLKYDGVAAMGDYDYSLTDLGRNRSREYVEECAYVGVAPVSFEDYAASVLAQTITAEHPRKEDLRRAFSDLLIAEEMFEILGPAINSGRGLFLYGAPGNGKTSIAERITRCFGNSIWIPRVLDLGGLLVKLFDPTVHEPIVNSLTPSSSDGRWVEIRRPTVVVGGELTMDRLEIRYDPVSRISEASLQMKSNNGTLLIDDFGRQRMQPVELLNRLIIPLEKRYDYQTLSNGKNIRVPFDQLTLFSTNLDPSNLVDEAFMRRIPYKVQVIDPDESMFRQLFHLLGPKLGFSALPNESLDYIIDHHYRRVGRPFRNCQPRDLLLQARNRCVYNNEPLSLSREVVDFAVGCYFTPM